MKLFIVTLFTLSLLAPALALPSAIKLSGNAKRLAQGLSPLPPRRLYQPHAARAPAPSPTTTDSATTTTTPTSPVATAAAVRAVYVGSVGRAVPTLPVKRQTIGSSAGHLTQVAHLQTSGPDIRFSITTDVEAAVGLYATDYQGGSPEPQSYLCLSNDHSMYSSRDYAVELSVDSGEWALLSTCGSDLDQPAGSPPTHDPAAVEPDFWAETRVWQIDPASGQISFNYVNPSGSVIQPTVVTVSCPDWGTPSSSFVFATGNPAMFLDTYFALLGPNASTDPDACTANELALFYETS